MKTIYLFLALVAGTTSFQSSASEELSQAEIRERVKSGEILSLETILQQFPQEQYGKLLDLEVEREHGRIIYEFEFLRTDGYINEIEVDASNGRILKQEIDD